RLALALIDQNRPTSRYQAIEPFDQLALQLAKTGMETGMEAELVGRAIKGYLELTAHDNDRYSSSSSRIPRRISQLEEIAKLLLNKRQVKEALNYLGMRQDGYRQGYDRGNDWMGSWALELVEGMKDRKAAYELLANFTFQGDGALSTIRAMVRRQPLPKWIPSSVGGGYPSFPPVADQDLPIATNFSLLAQLAAQSGQANDLMKRLEEARSSQRARAATASAIAHAVLQKPVDPMWLGEIEDYIDLIQPAEGKQRTSAPLAELQLASIVSQTHEDFSKKVVASMLRHTNEQSRGYLNPWVAGYQHKQGWAETSSLRTADDLTHWTRSTLASAKDYAEGKTPPIWVSDGQGRVDHVCGFIHDYLWFKYPLHGNFEIDLETSEGGWSEADPTFNDLRITPLGSGSYLYLKTQSSTRYGRIPSKSINKSGWNRCRLRVDEESCFFLGNDTRVLREKSPNQATSTTQKGGPGGASQPSLANAPTILSSTQGEVLARACID
ncbi:MAG: hypothetical protein AAF394_18890, partial [Planctomycetota bacterium]